MARLKISILNTYEHPLTIVLEPLGEDFTIEPDERLFFRAELQHEETWVAFGTGDTPECVHLSFETPDEIQVDAETSDGASVKCGYKRHLIKRRS